MQKSLKPFLSSLHVEMYLLALLSQKEAYGYMIAKTNDLYISEAVIYQTLRKLEKQNYIISYSQQHNTKLRKVYKITQKGDLRLKELLVAWQKFVLCMDTLFDEIPNDDA